MDEHKLLVIGVKDCAGNLLPSSLSVADYNWRCVKYSCSLNLLYLYSGFKREGLI